MNYLFPPYLPAGQVHVLAGSSGTGKTTLLTQALADPRITWGRVLYVGADRTMESYLQLQVRLGLTLPPTIRFFSLVDEMGKRIGAASLRADRITKLLDSQSTDSLFSLMWIEKLLRDAPADTVILDPAAPLLEISNFNDMRQVSRCMVFMAAWARHLNCTIILVFHTNKTKKDGDFLNVMNRISGSHALLGYASTKALLCSKDELDNGPALVLQGQHFADTVLFLARSEYGALFITTPDTKEAEEALDCPLLVYFPPDGAPIDPDALAKASSIPHRSVFRQLKTLVDSGLVTKSSRGLYSLVRA